MKTQILFLFLVFSIPLCAQKQTAQIEVADSTIIEQMRTAYQQLDQLKAESTKKIEGIQAEAQVVIIQKNAILDHLTKQANVHQMRLDSIQARQQLIIQQFTALQKPKTDEQKAASKKGEPSPKKP